MTTLRPTTSLWRRTRSTVIAGSIALGTILAPAGWVVADTGPASDGTSGATAEFEWDGASLESATAIGAAGGQGPELRAEPSRDAAVLSTIPNGTVVELRIDEADTVREGNVRWWPVAYGGQAGWVQGTDLLDASGLPAGAAPFEFDGSSLEGATARVRSGAGLHLRSEPSWNADVVDTIPGGTVVGLWIDETDTVYDPDGVTRWWPVEYNGQRGWVSGYYLTSASGDAAPTANATSTSTTREQFAWDGSDIQGATAIVDGGGEGVGLRSAPGQNADVLTSVADGTVVNLRIDRVDSVLDADGDTRWWPVEVDGTEGWISGYFLSDGSPSRPGPGASGSGIFPAGSTALVQTQSGDGARLRSSAGMDGEQIGSIAERSEVTILGGPASHDNSENGWFEIRTADGRTGYVDGDLLVLIATPAATATATSEATATSTATATATEPPTEESVADEVTPTATATESQRRAAATSTATATATSTSTADDVDEDEDDPDPTATATQPPSSNSQFVLPVSGAVLTQGFGCSSLGFYAYNPDWGCGVHDGVDYAAPAYTPIVAVADGTVVTAGWCDCGLGYYVEIDHGNNLHTIYGHMASQPYVSVGQQVSQGETIGPVGSTGLSTGPHVHFMVQVNGVSQDPARYLP